MVAEHSQKTTARVTFEKQDMVPSCIPDVLDNSKTRLHITTIYICVCVYIYVSASVYIYACVYAHI